MNFLIVRLSWGYWALKCIWSVHLLIFLHEPDMWAKNKTLWDEKKKNVAIVKPSLSQFGNLNHKMLKRGFQQVPGWWWKLHIFKDLKKKKKSLSIKWVYDNTEVVSFKSWKTGIGISHIWTQRQPWGRSSKSPLVPPTPPFLTGLEVTEGNCKWALWWCQT